MNVCGACGHENPDTAEFCQSCGRFLAYTRTTAADQPLARTPAPPAPADRGPQTLRDPVITLAVPVGTVSPGHSLVITARVRNASSIVDRVVVTIHGPSAAWWKVEPASVSLYPGTEAEVRLEFRPPKGSELLAGPTPVGLRAQTEPPEVRTTTSEFQVLVDPVTVPLSELVPRTSRGRRTGRHTLTLTNGGNAQWPATVRAVDPDARIRLQVSPETVEVPAGGRMSVAIVATGGFNFFGPADVRPFVVEVRPADGGPLITHEGRFEQSALFRALPLALLVGLAAAMLVVVAVLAGWIDWPPWKGSPSPSASLPTPSATATATPSPASPTASPSPSVTPTPVVTPSPGVAEWAQQWANELNLGAPNGVTVPTEDGIGAFQDFLDGVVYLRPDGDAWPIVGEIGKKWRCLLANYYELPCGSTSPLPGPVAALGYPTDQERMADGLPYQLFDSGGLYCSDQCAWAVYEPVESVWQPLRAALGLPIKDQLQTDQFGNASLGRFQEGFLLVQPSGTDWIACTYDGAVISSSGIQADCVGWAEYVENLNV
jgi:hypothetical protein